MTHKHAPGPIGTSCLTCKRRRKKCDRSQPTCERCTKGGFDCLGYTSHFILVDNLKEPGQQEDATSGSHAQPYQPRPPHAHPATENSWMMFPFVTLSSLEEQPVTYDTHASSILNAPLAPHLDGHLLHVLNVDKDDLTEYDAPFLVDSQQLLPAWQTPSPSQTYSAEHPFASTPGRSSLYSKNSLQGAPLSFYPLTSPQSRGQHAISIPRSVTLEPTDIANIVNYVLTQCERLATLSHFKPLPHQLVKFRKLVSGRLQSPGVARWVMYLGAQISESLFDGVLPEKAAIYERWIQKLEQELHVTPSRDITNDEVQNRLSCWIPEVEAEIQLPHT
ncbi:hypothetical protein BDV93DRAFT_553996 [Ceratobasidium sp. AG-I]|nr:hypothetical protein BDV93DRAFT_553996 [Ceratobasidium sp. AG-I]